MPAHLVIALLVAASSLPAFLAARMFARDRARLAMLMRLVGMAIVAGAIGLAWAGDERTRQIAVLLAVAVAVNAMGVIVLVDIMRRRRQGGG